MLAITVLPFGSVDNGLKEVLPYVILSGMM